MARSARMMDGFGLMRESKPAYSKWLEFVCVCSVLTLTLAGRLRKTRASHFVLRAATRRTAGKALAALVMACPHRSTIRIEFETRVSSQERGLPCKDLSGKTLHAHVVVRFSSHLRRRPIRLTHTLRRATVFRSTTQADRFRQ